MGDVFAPGTVLAGSKYRIDGLLGSGGMAQVYRAYDLGLARPVAVKTMRPGLDLDDGAAARFRDEARAMAALDHPHVVTVHATGEEPRPDGPPVPYFVMELVNGPSLAERLQTRGALPVSDAVPLADQVLSALGQGHGQGLVHRDIKPGNILLAPGGIAKVADFGIARALTRTAGTGTRAGIGTPHYMSPEQVRGAADLDGRSDLYAVGLLLFEMLTGRRPFDGDDAIALAVQHLTAPPPTLAASGLPGHPRLEAVVARALAKQPEDRYPDAAAMRGALREAVTADEPSRPRPPRATDASAGASAGAATGAAGGAWAAPRSPTAGYTAPAAHALFPPLPPPPGPAPTRPVPTGPAPRGQAGVLAPALPLPRRTRLLHDGRLAVCAVLAVTAWSFGVWGEQDNLLWAALVGLAAGMTGAIGSLPVWRPGRGTPASPHTSRYRVLSWILLLANLYCVVGGLVTAVKVGAELEDCVPNYGSTCARFQDAVR
ncbi:protein kinase [Streptomyces sp. NPDC089799]|uniref:protein kinase domain-containing protein n=1 Tax=Streptomyces sp. NPDC089799 TaxID=3155066 RepID=UPI0034477FD3